MSTIGRAMVLVIGIGLACWPAGGRADDREAPEVVVSIAPVHSLVTAVMAGIGEPTLLVKGAAAPHTASLRPSEAAALQRADVVFWIGEGLETFLSKPIAALPKRARVVTLAAAPGMTLLPARKGGVWEDHIHGQDDEHDHGHGDDYRAGESNREPVDMHVWLDPENAKTMAAAAVVALAEADPARAGTYAANARALSQRLDGLDRELRDKLAPVADKPYVVFHDAYQYFEARYGLRPAGAITLSPERTPGARTLSEIRERIRTLGAVCVFKEPQFEPDLVKTVVAGSFARVGVLDPIGAEIPPGADAYFALLTRLTSSLRDCLEP